MADLTKPRGTLTRVETTLTNPYSIIHSAEAKIWPRAIEIEPKNRRAIPNAITTKSNGITIRLARMVIGEKILK